jgi:hypothetical protein
MGSLSTFFWRKKTNDAKKIEPAITRLAKEQSLPIKSVWGDRGLHRVAKRGDLEIERHLQRPVSA